MVPSKCKVKVDRRTSSLREVHNKVQFSLLPYFYHHESPIAEDAATQVRGNSTELLYIQQGVLKQQTNLTLSFTQESGLTLNPQKCEVVVMSKTKHPKEVICSIDNNS